MAYGMVRHPLYQVDLMRGLPSPCRRSSVVERTLGKGEVLSSILSGGTIGGGLFLTLLFWDVFLFLSLAWS